MSRSLQTLTFIALSCLFMSVSSSCKRTGCMVDTPCVENYDPRAERQGECRGCTVFGAYNYCPDATEDNGRCLFVREFYSDISTEGWMDIWVADSADNNNVDFLRYEGRLTSFPTDIPDCDESESTLTIVRPDGEYYYEVETQTGQLVWGWVVYRQEGCRLLDVF